jgi:hypothetical protein
MSRLHRGRKALQKRLYGFASARGLIDGQDLVPENATDDAVVDSGRAVHRS